MDPRAERIFKAADFVKERLDGKVPVAGIVLGSGLGKLADKIENPIVIHYKDIPGFPVSTAIGHKGNFIAGELGGKFVIAMQGRLHYYEGYPMELVTLPIRVMKVLGISYLFVSNAAGGINFDFRVGDLMIIKDHINMLPNPLIGPNADEFGVRFPDMTSVYDEDLQEIIRNKAKEQRIDLKEGVYVQLTGPSFESPAEIRMLRTLGADAVGMSTVVEAIVANHMGMKICGISCVCNPAAGMNEQPLTHEEVQEASAKAAPLFEQLVTESIAAF